MIRRVSPIIWCEIGWCHENYKLPYNLSIHWFKVNTLKFHYKAHSDSIEIMTSYKVMNILFYFAPIKNELKCMEMSTMFI